MISKETIINILYEDSDLIIVEKPPFMLVHPWRDRVKDELDLMNALKQQTNHYLYPVHRIDRQVSGLVIFALTKKAARELKENWNDDHFIKEYLCLCRGKIDKEGVFNFDLKVDKKRNIWKSAKTCYYPRLYFKSMDCSFVKVRIKTGRKHQIRRHFSRRYFNLIGDRKYGTGSVNIEFQQLGLERIFLHSHHMRLSHPITKEIISIYSYLPNDLVSILNKLGLSDINTWLRKNNSKPNPDKENPKKISY